MKFLIKSQIAKSSKSIYWNITENHIEFYVVFIFNVSEEFLLKTCVDMADKIA
jgi:hypothetical protein